VSGQAQTQDGVTHEVHRPETSEQFGETTCGVVVTDESGAWRGITRARPVDAPVDCIACVANSGRPRRAP